MPLQLPVPDSAVLGQPASGEALAVDPSVLLLRTAIVNVFFLGDPRDEVWVLVDCGVRGYASTIIEAATQRYGVGAKPAGILMTHGHFDHVGALEELVEFWDVPVYANALEHPFLDGREAYPRADPFAGGGLMTLLSPLFPRDPVDVGCHLRALPDDGTVPHLPGWSWIHTPGHAPGHVSFWNPQLKLLVAGDACITTGQESAYRALVQSPEMHGPPRYFTSDWDAARRSVERLSQLPVETLVTGHGPPLRGASVGVDLRRLAERFDEVARPS